MVAKLEALMPSVGLDTTMCIVIREAKLQSLVVLQSLFTVSLFKTFPTQFLSFGPGYGTKGCDEHMDDGEGLPCCMGLVAGRTQMSMKCS
jgi:hypothetical protein